MAKELRIQLNDKESGFRFGFKTILYGVLLVVGLTLAAVIAFNLGRTDGLTTYRKELKAYQDTVVTPILALSDSLQKQTELLVQSADSAKKQSDSLSTRIATIQKSNTSLRTQNQRLSDSLRVTPLPPECDQCKQLVASLETEVDSLEVTVNNLEVRDSIRVSEIFSLRTGLLLQTTRGDSLQRVIINMPQPPRPKRVLGIELSNRTLFISGLVLGGVAVGTVK